MIGVYQEIKGNFRISVLFYEYYNIYNTVSDLLFVIYNS